jgi:hypothetical protein
MEEYARQTEEKRGPSPIDTALEEAFRAVHRLEAIEENLRERLSPALVPDYPREKLSEVAADRVEPAMLVKQIEEIAQRVSAVEERLSLTRDRLAL